MEKEQVGWNDNSRVSNSDCNLKNENKKNQAINEGDDRNESFFETSSYYNDKEPVVDESRRLDSTTLYGVNNVIFCKTAKGKLGEEKAGLEYLHQIGEVIFVENPYLKPSTIKEVVNEPYSKEAIAIEKEKSNI